MDNLHLLSRNEMKKINGGYVMSEGDCNVIPCDNAIGYIACCCLDGGKTCISKHDVTACANYCSGNGPY